MTEHAKQEYNCGDCVYYRGVNEEVLGAFDCGLIDAYTLACAPCRNFLHREVAYQILDEAKKKKE